MGNTNQIIGVTTFVRTRASRYKRQTRAQRKRNHMKRVLLVLTIIMVVIHYDFWNWGKVDPVVFGFVPVGLWYQAAYCVAAAFLLLLFVIFAWPKHLENAEPETPEARRAELGDGH